MNQQEIEQVNIHRPKIVKIFREYAPGLLSCAVLTLLALVINHFVPLLSTLLVAILLGAIVANIRPVPKAWQPGIAFASKQLLRFGIVLLGLQISIKTLIALGWQRLVLVVVVVSCGVCLTILIGRALGISKSLTGLIACGFSICGAAAVAGAKDVVDADEDETGTALALVVLFGTISIPVVPGLAYLFGLSTDGAATWAGASIHEVAQVVAAAALIGSDAMATAVAIKLARVVCLAGVLAGLSIWMRRSGQQTSSGKRPPLVPGFVLGFLAMVILGSVVSIPKPALDLIKFIQGASLAMAMTGLGFGIEFRKLIGVGPKPLVLGVFATLVVSVIALSGVLIIGG